MRSMMIALALVLIAGQALATDPEIVIFDSYALPYGNATPARDAAPYVTTNWKAYIAGEEALWIADVNDGADIIVFDVCSNYTGDQGEMPHIMSQQLDAMNAYLVEHPCSIGIIALWFMGYESYHPIFNLFDVQWCSDIYYTLPLYQWDPSHPILAGLPNPLNNYEDGWYVDGSMVNPIGGGTAIGGFSTSPGTCQAGLVVGDDFRTVYIGETGAGGIYDDDFDGIRDWTELYINIYNYTLGTSPSATEGATWGAVKGLYR